MSTADLTHEALSAALSADKPLAGEQRAVLVSMIAQEKRQTHYLDGEVARLTRERDSLRAELAALRGIGAQLANVAFNWSQDANGTGAKLTADERAMLKGLLRQWDEARRAAPTPAAAKPQETGNNAREAICAALLVGLPLSAEQRASLLVMLRTAADAEALRDALPPMPPTDDREPYEHDEADGYLESDDDWAERNSEAVAWLADNHRAIRAALAADAGRAEGGAS